jgi:hypothetical protein
MLINSTARPSNARRIHCSGSHLQQPLHLLQQQLCQLLSAPSVTSSHRRRCQHLPTPVAALCQQLLQFPHKLHQELALTQEGKPVTQDLQM